MFVCLLLFILITFKVSEKNNKLANLMINESVIGILVSVFDENNDKEIQVYFQTK